MTPDTEEAGTTMLEGDGKHGGPVVPSVPRSGASAAERWATGAEVMAALEALTPAALVRLKMFAGYRMRVARAPGRTSDDLMSEALTATLGGARRWNKASVDFTGHLCGVMRSISSHWRAQQDTGEVAWPEAGSDAVRSMTFDVPGSSPDAERAMIAAQEVAAIRDFFAGDDRVLAVIDALGDGFTGPEIKAALRLAQKDYETVLKRLRRGVERMRRGAEGVLSD